jgi:hypothetical protein
VRAPELRDIPTAVGAALRDVHRLVVHRRPWYEIAAALDVAAALPEATSSEMAELIALERLEALARYPVTAVMDDEVEQVLEATAAARAAMPDDEAAWLLLRAVAGRPALAKRHEIDPSIQPHEVVLFDDVAIAYADDDSRAIAIGEAIHYSLGLRRIGWPHDEACAVLDDAETLPEASSYLRDLAFGRLAVGNLYGLSENFMDDVFLRLRRAYADRPVWSIAHILATATSRHPALAVKYLPSVIAAAEDELRENPNEVGEDNLQMAREDLECARAAMAGHDDTSRD